ncbi:hypothetical protein EYZ11_005851 [Aspergillus tanneri]|uniref:Uncharacterized protein n=1 Tax=Aspergillus tanneri TaxID=1220188 RepID=A0A4S3JGX5_9EURO|nr:uncharacterized protein ATNIH1004_004246 [Aspergillus tanneri]KAA8648361.1 hypothetical protein ATNIH1004_004246 [Aspergillus tanneri]THC94666.1 hypothetical protein EYZ11_005851 [Aspergillus tanneri]
MTTSNSPSQPLKQAAYNQSKNPVTRTPAGQRVAPPPRQRGDPVPSINRHTADSRPSDDESLAHLQEKRQRQQVVMWDAIDVDLEYGAEQQPDEGDIAAAVKEKGRRAQAGAHAGPVGSAFGPGYTGVGEKRDLAADMGRECQEHDRVLGDSVGQSPPESNGETAEGTLETAGVGG